MCFPLAQYRNNVFDPLFTFAVTESGCKLTRAAPEPVPVWVLWGWMAPHCHESMSTQFLCFSSCDSPSTPSTFRYADVAIVCSFVNGDYVGGTGLDSTVPLIL